MTFRDRARSLLATAGFVGIVAVLVAVALATGTQCGPGAAGVYIAHVILISGCPR
jgi:hypothetical protein